MRLATKPLALTALWLALGLVPAACARLPSGAPISNEILRKPPPEAGEFALYQVTRAFLPSVAQWPATGGQERLGWIGTSRGARSQLIRPGDMLNLQVWDSSDNSLLSTAEARVAQLGEIEVAATGMIFVPYIGDVGVAGLTPDLARKKLQTSLEAIVPSAQVQLSLTEGRANSVDLIGGVASPGSYPMPDRDYTVLSLLAAGGGVRPELGNPQIRLMRGGAIYGTSVASLLDDPRLDTRLRGGDRVFVEEDSRYFLSFGATGTEALHPFPKDRVSAMDAVSIIGGVSDTRADPKGLLILREYPAAAIRPGIRGPRQSRVVFSIDLTSADGLFSARNFQINPNDLVVGTESPINDVNTVFSLIGRAFGIFGGFNRL